MATKYHSFNIFMDEVIKNANNRVNLEQLFVLDSGDIIKIISMLLIKADWYGFLAVVFLLLLGPIAFVAALATFGSTPIGWVVFAIFGTTTLVTIKTLYQNKELPIAVKEVGEEFKPKWERIEGNQEQIDYLLQEAVVALINKASAAQRRLFDI